MPKTLPTQERAVGRRRGSTPVRRDDVLATARDMLDEEGWDRLNMVALAERLRIKGPSLYNHVDNLDDLRRQLWILVVREMSEAIRNANPGGHDMIADFMAPDEDGVEFDDDLVFEFIYAMLAAGVDTTTSILSATFWYLEQHPDKRAQLIEQPSLIPLAREEFLRWFTPAQATARTAVSEVSVAGQTFQRGDRVLLPWASGNRDPSQFPRPDEFIIDRKPNNHLAFGYGIHRCVGAPLARLEFDVIVSAVLQRMPDYRIDHESTHNYRDLGLMYGYQRMPTSFTPGQAPLEWPGDDQRVSR